MRSLAPYLASLAVTHLWLAAPGQGENFTVVVPNGLESVEGNSGDGLTNISSVVGMRYLSVTSATQFASVPTTHRFIVTIKNRPDSGLSGPFDRIVPNTIEKLGVTNRDPSQLSVHFEDNYGEEPPKRVFLGSDVLSTEFLGPANGPKEFDMGSPLQQPFYYDPNDGNLLHEIILYSPVVGAGLDVQESELNPFGWIWSGDPQSSQATFADNRMPVRQYAFAPIPEGDYDLSGNVDEADMLLWQSSFSSTTDLAADGNGNGVIDGGDFLIWQRGYGTSVLDGLGNSVTVDAAFVAGTTPVPEPVTLLLLISAGGALLVCRFRHGAHARQVVAIAVMLSCYCSPAMAQSFDELVVFGDSMNDRGNWFIAWNTPAWSTGGRYSNGPVWVEEIAWQLGLEAPAPSHTGGTNYAWGGARTGFGLVPNLVNNVRIPTIGWQIEAFLTLDEATDSKLFVLNGGGNDIGLHGETNYADHVNNLVTHVSTLASAGATYIAVSNLPPLNVYPDLPLNLDEPTVRQYVNDFNALLATEMATLEGQLGISIYLLDWHGLAMDGRSNPVGYGLSNISDAAWEAGVTASDPEQYMFWDYAHFATSFQRFAGEMAAETIAAQLSSVTLSQSSDAAYSVLGTTETGGLSAEDLRLANTASIGPSGDNDERLVLKFRLPDLAAMDALIEEATLRVKVTSTSADPSTGIPLFHNTGDNDLMVESLDFDDAGYLPTGRAITRISDDAPYFYELDVTDLVLADYVADGADATAAFRLQSDGGETFTLGGDEILRPELLLSFQETTALADEMAIPEPSSVLLLCVSIVAGWLIKRG